MVHKRYAYYTLYYSFVEELNYIQACPNTNVIWNLSTIISMRLLAPPFTQAYVE